jgi:hypothetical protein
MLTIFTDHSYTVLTFYYTGARRACPSSNTDYRQFDNSELSCPVRIFRVKAVQPFGVIAQSPLVVCPRAGLPLAARGRITSRSSRKVAERLLQRPYKCDGTYKMHGWTCFVDCSIEDSKLRREEEGAGSEGAHSIYIL